VEYARPDGLSLQLDVALPPGPGPFPAVIMIHGGGWESGSRAEFHYPGLSFYVRPGVACVPIDYRLSDQAPYPAAVDDCLAAVRWVRAHAAQYKLDPDRLAVLGGSAGGYLALMVATEPTTATDRDSHGRQLSCLVTAAASLAGPTDLLAITQFRPGAPHQRGPNALRRMLGKFLGGSPEQLPDLYAQASPINRVTAAAPPTMLVYGLLDQLVPPEQALSMQAELQAAGVPVAMLPRPDQGHGAADIYTRTELVEWLTERLKAPAAGP
jgi:alpha-L-fucosidase 2